MEFTMFVAMKETIRRKTVKVWTLITSLHFLESYRSLIGSCNTHDKSASLKFVMLESDFQFT